MQRRGPDSIEGWFIALVCCFIATLMYGSAGLSSMLFVASIERYNTDRNQAAFPYILCNVLQAATGLIAGCLVKRFSERTVVMTGGLLAFVGIGACFFAETITVVTILWGIVFGAGYGLSTLLLPAIINYYFFKHRSKALGLSFLGSPIGFLVFPPILEVLLKEYGLSGTFLFLSAIIMHCIPLSLFLRKPNFKKDLAIQPLSSSEQVTYLSTGSGIASLKPKFENSNALSSNEISTFIPTPRRFSLEFLWQSISIEQDSNPYFLNLNKNYPCCNGTVNQKARSYEEINGNFYKKTNKRECCASTYHPAHSLAKTESDELKLKLNMNFGEKMNCFSCKCELFNEFEIQHSNPPEKNTEISSNIKGTKQDNITKLSNVKHDHLYTQFSTIYFGTNWKICDINKSIVNISLESNSTNAKKTGKHTNTCCRNLVAENDYTNNISSTTLTSLLSNVEASNIPNYNAISNYNQNNTTGRSDKNLHISLLSVYCNPLFILMSICNAIFSLQFATLSTVIIDFARDHNIDPNNDKFIMMCISLMGVCGMLGFGWVTDGGYMRRNRFASLCLLIGSISIAILPMTVDFAALIAVLSMWCISQSSFILLVPAILAEYFHEDVQTAAVSACNVLCAPLYFIIPPLIGYFRDGKGSYHHIFYLLSALSLLNSVAVFTVPCILKFKDGTSNR